jgi:hypothetical protein
MNQETVTLIAAVVAAAASFISLSINLFAQRTSEMRVAYRNHLGPNLTELSDLIHQTVATSNMLVRQTSENHATRYQNWRRKSTDVANRLKDLRPKVRYPLWGLDEGVRVITRFPNWVDQNRAHSNVQELLNGGDRLRRALDFSIRNSFQYGRPPTLLERMLVNLAAKNLRKIYKGFAQMNDEQDEELLN